MERKKVTIDGNEAAAYIAYQANEVIAIYPITPSSNMGEWCDAWASVGKKNIWNIVPSVSELQSEGGHQAQFMVLCKPVRYQQLLLHPRDYS